MVLSTDDVILAYHLNENAANTTVTDSKGTSNGTSANNTSTMYDASGEFSSALNFDDGSGDYINTNYTPNINPSTTARTVSCWVKAEEESVTDVVWGTAVGTNQRFYMRVDVGGKWKFYSDGSTNLLESTTNVNYNNWVNIIITTDGAGAMEMFINGTSEDTGTTNSFTTTGNLFLGNLSATASLTGSIDEFILFNRELTQTEITSLQTITYPFTTDVTVNLSTITMSMTDNEPTIIVTTGLDTIEMSMTAISPTIINTTPKIEPIYREMSKNFPIPYFVRTGRKA